MRQLFSIFATSLSILLGAAAPAAALTTAWNFEGVVRDCLSGGLAPSCPTSLTDVGVDDGTPLSGFLIVDDSTPGTVLDADRTQYQGAILSGAFSAGDLTLTLNSPATLTAALNRNVSDSPPEGTSLYRIISSLGGVDVEPAIGGNFDIMLIDLEDSGQDAITTTAFPTAPPDLADLDPYDQNGGPFITSVSFILTSGDGFFAEITSLTQASVPEPGTGLLLALALTAAVRLGRRS